MPRTLPGPRERGWEMGTYSTTACPNNKACIQTPPRARGSGSSKAASRRVPQLVPALAPGAHGMGGLSAGLVRGRSRRARGPCGCAQRTAHPDLFAGCQHSLILVSVTRVYRAQSSPLKGWGACRASGPTWGSSPRRLRRAVRLCLKTLQLAGGRRAVLCETHPPLPSVLLPLCHTCAQPYRGARPSRRTARAHALRLDRWPSVNIPMPMPPTHQAS